MILLALCLVAKVVDGDTIACADRTRLRLYGIDAPEMPGHCRRGRICAPGNPFASRESLRRLAGTAVSYRIVDADRCRRGFQPFDRYGRRIAEVYARGVDLSFVQLKRGFAVNYQWRCRS